MRCHYEVLEIDRGADEEEIKKQYRKLALRWHPDKNTANPEEATERFKEITAAHNVLSNPHERKWYDDHREAILRGEADSDDDDDDDMDINVWPYFSSSCYSGEPDGPNGFYTVYAELFERIDEREREYAAYGSNKAVAGEIRPPFGNSTSEDKVVSNFYNYWSNFVSSLSFAELDRFDTNDETIPRHIRRAMEKENRKSRTNGRKEYMDSIHQLVAYMKRTDDRAIRMEQELKERRQREKEAAEQRRQDEIAKKRAELAKKTEEFQNNEQEIERSKSERQRAFLLDNDYDDLEYFSYSAATEDANPGVALPRGAVKNTNSGQVVFQCAVCNREYKTDKQLAQHLNSKQHKQKEKEERNRYKGGKGSSKKESSKIKGKEKEVEDREADMDMGVASPGAPLLQGESQSSAGVQSVFQRLPDEEEVE